MKRKIIELVLRILNMTPSEKLYFTAKYQLNKNLAPGNERLGCAIAMSAVHNIAFPNEEPLRFVNTTQWYNYMKNSFRWKQIDEPESDCVVVSVTELIPYESPLKNGHIGVIGRFPRLMERFTL